MNVIALGGSGRRARLLSRSSSLFAVVILTLAAPFLTTGAAPAARVNDNTAENDEIISLAAYNVKADRIEDFGLRVASSLYSKEPKTGGGFFLSKFAPIITAVLPNTAAAKAGLRPGERILKSEGQSTAGGLFSTGVLGKWYKTEKKKWAEVSAGKTNVTWTLEIETPATKAVRTVKLVVPTPPPHWGASVWRAPEGRSLSTVAESGPLAVRSRDVLDHGIWTLLDRDIAHALGALVQVHVTGFPSGLEPTGYQWKIGTRQQEHLIFVTQFRGRTDVLLETRSPSTGRRVYLTSPSGQLERAWQWTRKEKTGEVSLEKARVGFEHELDLWTTKVAKASGRWPFEVQSGYDPHAIFAVLAPSDGTPTGEVVRPFAKEFLKLRPATESEQAIFSEAFGKLGAEPDSWAYTETSRGLEDKRVIVTRLDPSKPETERCVLLSINGKSPTAAEMQQWRDEGGDTPKPLGDIPPLASIVDLTDLRVFQDQAAAVVFELPIRKGQGDFPTEKFQALFRVSKVRRSFEDIAVKMRDSFRVGGVVKITQAGLQARFQTLDPAHPPQPVYLKGGGAARVLLVKISRTFETTRADFKRVEPYVEPDPLEPAAMPISLPTPETR